MKKNLPLLGISLAITGCQAATQAYSIPSAAMSPTLKVNDRIIVNNLKRPNRLDIITFTSPNGFDPILNKNNGGQKACWAKNIPILRTLLAKQTQNPACSKFIKRVVGIEGDKIHVDKRGKVTLNGTILNEPYVSHFCRLNTQGDSRCRELDVTVPDGHVVVLGDNRNNSFDSRYWPGGPFVPLKEVSGVASAIIYPLGRAREL